MNKLSLFILLIVLFSANVNSQWISFDKNNQYEPKKPDITLLASDEINAVIKAELHGFTLKNTDVNGNYYQSLDLIGDASTNEAGKPDLPLITKVIAVPNDASVSVEVIDFGEVKIYKGINLLPARKSWYEGDPETEFIEDEVAYLSNNKYPAEVVSIDNPSVFRDFRIVRVAISPSQYIASKKELHVYSSVTVRLNYINDGKAINPKTASNRPIAPSYNKLYKSFIFNYDEILDQRYAGKVTAHELMLCIVPDILYDDFLPYADWKRKSGVDIVITKFSDIGATANNPTTIKNHIADAYMNWDVPPTYVLNVGDSNLFPIKIVNYDYSFANENYYVEIDGNDFLPEMMIGRLPNENASVLQVVVNKSLLYEKEPYIDEPEWFKKGLCASNNAYQSQVDTKVFTSNVMQIDGGFTSVDELMSTTPCTSDTQDVIDGLNEGRSFVNYRGEGWYDGWWATCTQFNVNHLNNLVSSRKNAFFTSIGCGVSHFYNYFSFGEQLLEMGTVNEPKGAIAFVGPGSNTHTDWNNHIDKGIYIGMFQDKLETPGEGLASGLLYMYNAFGAADPWVEYHYRVYYVLGDPSIHIWKDTPRAINVNHVVSIPVGNNDIQVSVTHQDTNQPTENAQVTITGNDDLFITGITDVNGEVTLSGDILNGGSLSVTVRGPNVIPYQGTIAVGLGISDIESNILRLSCNPNPFNTNSGVDITYTLFEKNNTSLRIYNVNGQIITELQNGTQNLGDHVVQWKGQNSNGAFVNPGVYYCQLISGSLVNTIKLLVEK